MNEQAETWYNASAWYMKKLFTVHEWDCYVTAMQVEFLNRLKDGKVCGKMIERRYKLNIESYLMDMKTQKYMVSLVGTLRTIMSRDGLPEYLQSRM